MKALNATAVLLVDSVEATRDFFRRAGFEATVEVPAGDALGFAILVKDGAQVMAQSRGNPHEPEELRALSRESRRAAVFIEVDDLDALIAALAGFRVAAGRRKTFYGADEITYEEPGGNLVTFARMSR